MDIQILHQKIKLYEEFLNKVNHKVICKTIGLRDSYEVGVFKGYVDVCNSCFPLVTINGKDLVHMGIVIHHSKGMISMLDKMNEKEQWDYLIEKIKSDKIHRL